MSVEPQAVPQSYLRIRREHHWVALFFSLNVCMDNQQIGRLRAGEQRTFAVPPGGHAFQVELRWRVHGYGRSEPLQLDVTRGQTTDLVCGSMFTGWKVFLSSPLPLLHREPAWFLRPATETIQP